MKDSIEQKAKDLLHQFSFIEHNQETGKKIYNKTLKEAANQCAIICVDVILSTRAYNEELSGYDRTFWIKVKERLLANNKLKQ